MMKTKKTIFAAGILAVLVAASLAFTSCGGDNADRASGSAVPEQETVIDKPADKRDSKDSDASEDAKTGAENTDNKSEKGDTSDSAKDKSGSAKTTDTKKNTDSSSGKADSPSSGANSSSGNTSSGKKPSTGSGSSGSSSKPSAGSNNGGSSKPSTGSGNNSSSSKPSTGSGNNSSGSKPSEDSDSAAQPEHQHTWETVYEDKYVDPVVETRPVYEEHTVCNQCGMDFGASVEGNDAAIIHVATTPGCQNYSVKRVQTGTEQVTIQKGYTTKVPVGKQCSTCGDKAK